MLYTYYIIKYYFIMEQPNFVVNARRRKRANTASWKALTMLIALAVLITESNGANLVADIAAYSSTACAGQCNYGSNMSHVDATAHCIPYAMRYCNFPIPLFFTSLCRIEVYFTNCSTISRASSGCLNSFFCQTRHFNTQSAPKPLRKFRGYYKNWGIPQVCVDIPFIGNTCTPGFSYNMASGFLLYATDNTQYSFGSNHSVSRGDKELDGRIIGFRYETSLAWDRFSVRVGRCAVHTGNFPSNTLVMGTNNWRSYLTSGAGYTPSTYCPGDTFSIQSYNPSNGADFAYMSSQGKIKFAPHANKVRYVRAYTLVLRHAKSYVYNQQDFTFAFTVTVGTLCPSKAIVTPNSPPSSVTTGAGWPSATTTSDTTIVTTLINDADGTSWSTVCGNPQAAISLSGNNSFITVVNPRKVRIQPTLVAHVASQTFNVIQTMSGYTTKTTSVTVNIVAECASKTWKTITGQQASPFLTAETKTFTITRQLNPDVAGVTWSNRCGLADLTLANQQDFVTLNASTGVVTMSPTLVRHVGTFTFQMIRQKSGVNQVSNVALTITVNPVCNNKVFIVPTGMPTSVTTGAQWPSLVTTVDTLQVRTLQLDSDNTSWSTVCTVGTPAAAAITLSSNNDLITVVAPNTVRIRPIFVRHVASQTFNVIQSLSGYGTGIGFPNAARTTSFTVNIVAECASKTWKTITGQQAVPFWTAETKTFTVTRELNNDLENVTWSDRCNLAVLTLTNHPDFITFDATSGVVTMSPTLVRHVGDWTFQMVRQVTGVNEVSTTPLTITVYPVCNDKTWQLMTNIPIGNVEMDAKRTISIPTILMVDTDTTPRTWSDVCGGPAIITQLTPPGYVYLLKTSLLTINYSVIRPRYVQDLGTINWSIKQTGTFAPTGTSPKKDTVPFTKSITSVIIMPDYKCAQKAWQPITSIPTGIHALQDTVRFVVPILLEVDGKGISWSVACGGAGAPSLEGQQGHTKLELTPNTLVLNTVTMNPTLISDVGTITFFVWQSGPAVTSRKKNTIAVQIGCDQSGTLDCLLPTFALDLVKQKKVVGEKWTYPMPVIVDPLGMAITTTATILPFDATQYTKYNKDARTFVIWANSEGEVPGKVDITIDVSAPEANGTGGPRRVQQKFELTIREKTSGGQPAGPTDAEQAIIDNEKRLQEIQEAEMSEGEKDISVLLDEVTSPEDTAPVIKIHYIYIYILITSVNIEDITLEQPQFHDDDSVDGRPGTLVGCAPEDTPPTDYVCVKREYDKLVIIYGEDKIPGPQRPQEEDAIDELLSTPDEPVIVQDPETGPATAEEVAAAAQAAAAKEASKRYLTLIISKIKESRVQAKLEGKKYTNKSVQPGAKEKKVEGFKANIDSVSNVGEITVKFNQAIHFLPDMPLPNKRTMNLQFDQYGTDRYFEEKRGEIKKDGSAKSARLLKALQSQEAAHEKVVAQKKDTDWDCMNITSTNITLRMNFTDPYVVSSKQDFPDLLKIKFTKRYFYLSTVKNQPLPDNLEMKSDVPKQFKSKAEKETSVAAASGAQTVLVGTFCLAIVFQLIAQTVIKKIWPMYNTIQMILIFLSLDIWLPGNVDDMLVKMKETLEIGAGDVAKNFKLDVDVRNMLTPMEMLLFIGVPVMLVLVIIGTALICALPNIQKDPIKRQKCKDKIEFYRDKLFLDVIMRTFIAMYLLLCFKAKITETVSGAQYEAGFAQKILIGVCIFLPVATTIFPLIIDDPKKLENKQFRKNFGSLYPDVNVRKGIQARLVVPIFFFRRLVVVLLLHHSLEHIHMFMMSVTCLFMLCYYMNAKPFNNPFQLKMECMNEGFLWILSYFTPVFSHFVNESWVRFSAGWVFVGICIIMVLVNLTIVGISAVKIGILRYRKYKFMKFYGLTEEPKSKLKAAEEEKDKVIELKPEDIVFPEPAKSKMTFQKSFAKMMKQRIKEAEKLAKAQAENPVDGELISAQQEQLQAIKRQGAMDKLKELRNQVKAAKVAMLAPPEDNQDKREDIGDMMSRMKMRMMGQIKQKKRDAAKEKAKEKLDKDFERSKNITVELSQLRECALTPDTGVRLDDEDFWAATDARKTAMEVKVPETPKTKPVAKAVGKAAPVKPQPQAKAKPATPVKLAPTTNDIKMQKSMGKSALSGMSDLLSSSTPAKPKKSGKVVDADVTPPAVQVKAELAEIEEVPEPAAEVKEETDKKKDVMTAMGVEFLKAMQAQNSKGAAKGKKK